MADKIGGLRINSLSPSAISTWGQCLLKFWYKYHTREKGVVDSLALRYGNAVHAAMEDLGRRIMGGEPLTNDLCEEIAVKFVEYAARYQIADPALIQEGQQMVRDRILRHNPNYKITGVELRMKSFGITTDKGVPLNGIIDLALEMNPTTAIILDYKTSHKALTMEEARSDIQLSMYDYMYSKIHPEYQKIWLALEYLRHEVVISERNMDERLAFEAWLNGVWEAMGDMSEKDVFGSPNQYCGWCEFRNLCPEYQNLLNKPFNAPPALAISDPTEFANEWEKVKILEKIVKNRISELKNWADNKVSMDGVVQFDGDNKSVSWSQGNRTYYDTKKIIEVIPKEDLHKVISVKNEGLSQYVNKERPDLKAAIEVAERVYPKAPVLRTKSKE